MSYLSIGLRVFWLLFPTLIYYLFAFIIFDRYLSNGYFYMFAFTCCWFFSCSRLRTFSTFNRYVSIALLPLAVFCEGFFSLSLSFCTQEQYTFCLSCTWRFFFSTLLILSYRWNLFLCRAHFDQYVYFSAVRFALLIARCYTNMPICQNGI